MIRTAQRLGVRTVAVYSDADARTAHVALADERVRLGGAAASDSYLKRDALLDACAATGAKALHPGYGFLSEDAGLADACSAAGVAFVGPSGDAMRAMGDKAAAKQLMRGASVPVTPGYDELPGADAMTLKAAAREHVGFPLLIKAVAGGGGKGMRAVAREEDFDAALESCRREAANSFANDDVILERLLVAPRHVEVQVFGDAHRNAVHLGERDCSVQRRHQKVFEEAPAPFLAADTRAALGEAAAARAVGYVARARSSLGSTRPENMGAPTCG